ncbi:hypothetical protein I4U23_011642 [Adineta vaga]|nr:hypothetical protein I4U23_011642 [Adineta vaga]
MREILHLEKIALPQIVGKSSILEAISGVELPRAQGICTRCPLELRIKRAPADKKDHATIRCEGVEETTLEDLSQISNAVVQCTNHLTGDAISVSSSPIFLTVYKQNVQDDLTLIDLPGIVRAQEKGQKPTVYQDIVALIHKCVEPGSAIVLHVIPSCVDFTTSESIQICQQYDPRYERQIIAVSKIDKHDQGIGDKLQGVGPGSIAFSLGCVAVLNRKQEEIDANISFEEMRRREQDFFRKNPAFKNVPKEYLGSYELVKKLVSVQQNRIRSTLPIIIEQVKHRIELAREELKRFPSAILTENDARIAFIEILRSYRTAVEKCAKGDYAINTEKAGETFDPKARNKWDERIAFHLKMIGKETSNQIQQILSQFASEKQRGITLKLIEENYGGGLPNFPTFNIIQQLYQPCHKKLERPCKELVVWVEDYITCCLMYILESVLPKEAAYKLSLGQELSKIIKKTIGTSKEKCMEHVQQMLEIEEKVFTVNPQYMNTFMELKKQSTTTTTTPNSDIAAHDALLGLRAYCSIVHARINDHLSQLCEYWFIRNGVLILDNKLNTALTPSELLKVMKELPILEQRRNDLRRTIDAMERALAAAEAE